MMDKNRCFVPQDPKKPAKKGRFWKELPPWSKSVIGFVACALIITAALSYWGYIRMRNAYETSRQNMYDACYQTAYDFAEARNHVSNDVLISVEAAQQVSRLEVLTVSDAEFVIKDAEKGDPITSWLEVQGTGVFTVDLSAGEFIVDSERQYVLARVPKPVLTECAVSGTGKQFWNSSPISGGQINFSNGSVAEGVQLAQDQLKEGRIILEDSMKQNRQFYEAAKEAAAVMVESLVRQWNPSVSDLQVEIEFIESNS